MKAEIRAERVKELLAYSPDTGVFVWKSWRGGSAVRGSVAGSVTNKGYRVIGIDGTQYLAHRLAFLVANGRWPADLMDHRNGRTDDNRLANLRECNKSQNEANTKARATSKSGLKGVSLNGQRPEGEKPWLARIMDNGNYKHLGVFETKELAANAYDEAAARIHGEFALFNYRRPFA